MRNFTSSEIQSLKLFFKENIVLASKKIFWGSYT